MSHPRQSGRSSFDHDDQVVYSPHIYQEGIDAGTLEEGFAKAADEAVRLYRGAPVVTGEWGAPPARAADPHAYPAARQGLVPEVWGFFDLNCETNTVEGPRVALTEVESVPWFEGTLFYASANGGAWSIRLTR